MENKKKIPNHELKMNYWQKIAFLEELMKEVENSRTVNTYQFLREHRNYLINKESDEQEHQEATWN